MHGKRKGKKLCVLPYGIASYHDKFDSNFHRTKQMLKGFCKETQVYAPSQLYTHHSLITITFEMVASYRYMFSLPLLI